MISMDDNARSQSNSIMLCQEENVEEKEKVVYIQLKLCLNTLTEINIGKEIMKGVTLAPNMCCKAIRKLLLLSFNLQDDTLVLKLRNHKNFLIPLSSYCIPTNTPDSPYILEVCNRYQNVKPFERTVSVPTYEQVLKRKLQSVDKRLTKLEDYVPCLPDKQMLKVEEEIRDLNEKMNVLHRKLQEADDTQWQGMFKRNPLW